MKVLLLNRDITHASAPQKLQGYSGVTYGVSRWNPEYNCHTVDLTIEQYEACWDDIQRALHLMMRKWFPRFIVPAAVNEFSDGYQLGLRDVDMDGGELPEGATEATKAGFRAGKQQLVLLRCTPLKPDTINTKGAPFSDARISVINKIYTESELRQIGKKFFSLIPIAKTLGVEPKKGQGGEALIKAILEAQLQPV